jgi:hypothetical protein
VISIIRFLPPSFVKCHEHNQRARVLNGNDCHPASTRKEERIDSEKCAKFSLCKIKAKACFCCLYAKSASSIAQYCLSFNYYGASAGKKTNENPQQQECGKFAHPA